MKEQEQKPTYFGIRFADLTEEILADILKLFLETGGMGESDWKRRTLTQDNISNQIENSNNAEFRFGSRFTGHSKLNVRRVYYSGVERDVVEFKAYGNTHGDNLSKKEMREVKDWEEQFRQAASDYLEKTGKGIPFTERY